MVLDITRSHPPGSSAEPISLPKRSANVTWEPLPADYQLPDDPVENIQQPALANALTDALGAANLIQPEMLVASNFALVAKINKKTIVKAPDWLLVPQVNPLPSGQIRRSYTPHAEGSPVAIVMEFLSDEDGNELSMRTSYPYGKLYFYEQILKVPTYVTFDPYEAALEVRQLQPDGHYRLQLPDAQERFWIPELEIFLGVWQGDRINQVADWLRWWDADGVMLPWQSERVEQEQQKVQAERQKVEVERQKAEQERQKAQAERQKAEAERQKAEAESQKAEAERQKAEQERQRAEQAEDRSALLAAKLRELGIDPDAI